MSFAVVPDSKPVQDCVICFEPIDETKETMACQAANHVFHGDCMRRWLKESDKCPLCRFKFSKEETGESLPINESTRLQDTGIPSTTARVRSPLEMAVYAAYSGAVMAGAGAAVGIIMGTEVAIVAGTALVAASAYELSSSEIDSSALFLLMGPAMAMAARAATVAAEEVSSFPGTGLPLIGSAIAMTARAVRVGMGIVRGEIALLMGAIGGVALAETAIARIGELDGVDRQNIAMGMMIAGWASIIAGAQGVTLTPLSALLLVVALVSGMTGILYHHTRPGR